MNRGECYSHWPNVPILGVKTRLMTMHKKIAIIDIVSIMAINLEGVDTLDAPPTREPDLGHKKNPDSPAYCVLLANYSPISSGCFNSFDFGSNNLSNRVLFRCFASLSNLS